MTKDNLAPEKLYLLQLAAKSIPSADGPAMEMVLGCYLIVTGKGRRVLVDTGMSPDARPPEAPPPTQEKTVLELLADLGVKPEDIDTVVCSHFDVDHAGFHDAFPHAEFVVQREHYELALGGHPRLAKARIHWDHPGLRYRLLDGDTELLPGLTLLETSGHVAGHQSVLVRLPKAGSVLLAIDAVMMSRLFTPDRPAWPHDENLDQLRASTVKLLDTAERSKASLVVFGHDGRQWQTLRKAPDYYD
jgi:N-acyl homoserine lactone hydrolase